MLSTKGTGLAVPKMPYHETALAAEVRFALHCQSKSSPFLQARNNTVQPIKNYTKPANGTHPSENSPPHEASR